MNRIAVILVAGISSLAIASAVQAADLVIEQPVEAGVVDVSGNWDGVYVGGFVGGLWGTGEFETATGSWDQSGWLAGVNLGANFTVADGIVAGVVADIAWADVSGTNDFTPLVDFDITWTGSLRGRLGFDGGAFLPYLTAGLAVAGGELVGGATESQTHVGWTAGAGVEFAVTDNLSIDALYRYSDYGAQSYAIVSGAEGQMTTHQATIGVNFKF